MTGYDRSAVGFMCSCETDNCVRISFFEKESNTETRALVSCVRLCVKSETPISWRRFIGFIFGGYYVLIERADPIQIDILCIRQLDK